MKNKIFLLLISAIGLQFANAQSQVLVQNQTTCALDIVFSLVDGSCEYSRTLSYTLAPGQNIAPTAPSGEFFNSVKFKYVECPKNFGKVIQGGCVCTPNQPSNSSALVCESCSNDPVQYSWVCNYQGGPLGRVLFHH